jgi:hypothetical protein
MVKMKLIEEIQGDYSEYPLSYYFIDEREKKEPLLYIKGDLYDSNHYFDLSPFYKPISNI